MINGDVLRAMLAAQISVWRKTADNYREEADDLDSDQDVEKDMMSIEANRLARCADEIETLMRKVEAHG